VATLSQLFRADAGNGRHNREWGEQHSYIASEENFRAIKRMETENRIVPIVGDFAGEKALRSVGQYIREHDASISAFYTSTSSSTCFKRRLAQIPGDCSGTADNCR
jgi:hypothetical protein